MELFDLRDEQYLILYTVICGLQIFVKNSTDSAKLVSPIIRLPAGMICPGGPLRCRFNEIKKQTNKAQLCSAAEIQVFLVSSCRFVPNVTLSSSDVLCVYVELLVEALTDSHCSYCFRLYYVMLTSNSN